MTFQLDSRLASSTIFLGDWPLCRVLLKDNAEYPWLILVPRQNNVQDMTELSSALRHQLMDEIAELSSIMNTFFNPDKLNIATLGNMVSQLHVHIVARFVDDQLWPHGIWQASQTHTPYSEDKLKQIARELSLLMRATVPGKILKKNMR